MAALVINGVYFSYNMTWSNVVVAGPCTGVCLIANTLNIPVTLNSGAISGAAAARFSLPGGQFPVTLQPNQTAVIQVAFDGAPGTLVFPTSFSAVLAIATSNSNFNPLQNLTGIVTGTGNQFGGQTFPSNTVGFPTTKIGQTVTLSQFRISSTANNVIRITNIALVTGTDFFLTGAPIVPFNINPFAVSPLFGIQFTPTVAGGRNDTLNVTIDDGAGGHISTVAVLLQGTGSTLQSAFNLTGATSSTLFGVSGSASPLVLLASPSNLNCEEPGSLVKLHDFGIINLEKQWMRIRGHYEDLGAATVSFKLRSRRQGKPDDVQTVNTPIGTAFADGWIREFVSEPTPVSGELIQITIIRAGNAGPVSLIDYVPEYEPKGAVIGGT